MRGHRVFVVGHRDRVERPDLDNTRVVDEDVERAEALGCCRDDALHFGTVADIDDKSDDVDTASAKICLGTRELIGIAPADRDARFAPPEFTRQLEPEPARTARDEHAATGRLHVPIATCGTLADALRGLLPSSHGPIYTR